MIVWIILLLHPITTNVGFTTAITQAPSAHHLQVRPAATVPPKGTTPVILHPVARL